jgi:small subunit ribosomal protein S17
MTENVKKSVKRKLVGTVVSDKMDKTVTVKVVRHYKHAKYSKYIHESKKYHAHDASNKAKVGDNVTIIESRPYSKSKKWELMAVN